MEILNRFITSGIIDDNWQIYNDENANIFYEEKILDIVKNTDKSYTYNIKFHQKEKYLTCYNGLYYELDNNKSENSLYYVFYLGAFVIFVSYIGNYILIDNYSFVKISGASDKMFVFYFCDIDNDEMKGFISDSNSNETEVEEEEIDLIEYIENNSGTILIDREKVLEKGVIMKRGIDLNILQEPVIAENYTLIETLSYIIDNWDNLPDLLYIISSPVLLKFMAEEKDCIESNSMVSLDETKCGIKENNYKIEGNTAISKQYKLKNFWIKELKFNIPSKGLIYYNKYGNYILSREKLKSNNRDFYKKIYDCRNMISYSVLEVYIKYSFNYIFNKI